MSMAGTVVSPGGGMAVAFAMILFTWLIRLAGLAVSVYIVVLLVRPSGILGKTIKEKV